MQSDTPSKEALAAAGKYLDQPSVHQTGYDLAIAFDRFASQAQGSPEYRLSAEEHAALHTAHMRSVEVVGKLERQGSPPDGLEEPTHYCVVCAARWTNRPDGTWSTQSPCGPCCDNVLVPLLDGVVVDRKAADAKRSAYRKTLRARQPAGDVEAVINDIVRDVCELPGDTDPDDDDALLLTVDDLRAILEHRIAALPAPAITEAMVEAGAAAIAPGIAASLVPGIIRNSHEYVRNKSLQLSRDCLTAALGAKP